MKIVNKFTKFMKNRYGIDELCTFLFKIYLLLILVNIFLKSMIIYIIELLLIIILIYRFLSKNIYSRSLENKKFLRIKNKIFNKSNHIYKKCHKCKTTLRLPVPKKIGIKHVVCPDCKKRNTYLILRRKK